MMAAVAGKGAHHEAVIYYIKGTFGYAWCPQSKENVFFSVSSTEFPEFPFRSLVLGNDVTVRATGKLARQHQNTDTRATTVIMGVVKVSKWVVVGSGTMISNATNESWGTVEDSNGTRLSCPGWAYGDGVTIENLQGKKVHFMALPQDPNKKQKGPVVFQVHVHVSGCDGDDGMDLVNHWTPTPKRMSVNEIVRKMKLKDDKVYAWIYSPDNCKEHVAKAMMYVTNNWPPDRVKDLLDRCEHIFLWTAFGDGAGRPDSDTIRKEMEVLFSEDLANFRTLSGLDKFDRQQKQSTSTKETK